MTTVPSRLRIFLSGFSAFERRALAAAFERRLEPRAYALVESLADADFIVADAEQSGAAEAVRAAGRAPDAVFVGPQSPEGGLAWMMRPVDPLHVLRAIDGAARLRDPAAAPGPEPTRRARPGRAGVGRRAGDDPTR